MTPPFERAALSRRGVLRLAGAAAIAGVAAPATAACSGAPKTDTPGGGGTFTIYWNAGHGYKAYDKVIADFEKAHGVTVNFQKYQWPDLRTRLLADMSAGTVPDLVETTGPWVQEFAVSGDALSLQSYVDRDGAQMGFPSDWQPATVQRNSYQGKVYGVQLHLTCSLLLYNKKVLAAAGVTPPTTWEEFLTAAKTLTTKDMHGVALNQDASYSWPWLLQNGVRPFDPSSGQILISREAAVEALQFQADLVHLHKVSPVPVPSTDYAGPQKLFSANRAAMIITGPWDLKPIADTSPNLELGIAPALKRRTQATIAAGASMMVPAKAKQPDLSWDFIKRITALEVERTATAEAGMLMPRKSWTQQPEVQSKPELKAFAEGLAYAQDVMIDLGPTGRSGKVEELYKTLYHSVVVQAKPAAAAVAEFADAAQKAVKG